MNARQFVVVGAVLVALGGCSTTGDSAAAPTQAPQAAAEASVAAAQRAAAADDVDSYVAALKAVDAKLAADKDVAVDNGKKICLDVEQGKTDADIAKSAAARLDVDQAVAVKVVAATKKSLCPAK
ncbi:DUF732 domain-containing protein [Actinoplanes sp. NPDC026619]|uniref:DUF732 domain-containing protein n=1 Tax=Actinoplanes sp. NPDC026619 TaxID=3155798 RepID=UPI0033D740E7